MARATESMDIYISGYGIGAVVQDRPVQLANMSSVAANIRPGAGLGLRIGFFPELTRRVAGVELEYFGFYQRFSFLTPNPSGSPGLAQGSSGLLVTNSMVNLVLRRPTGDLRPYAGFGVGYASGVLHSPTIPGRSTGDWDSTAAFAYQFIAGVHAQAGARTFLFAEYKWVAADYHWNGFAMDVRTQAVAFGVGYMF